MEEEVDPKDIRKIKFRGIDDYNRPVYKYVDNNIYIGSTDVLFPCEKIAPNGTAKEINAYFRENLDKLVYFGLTFNCEPEGGRFKDNIKFEIID